MAKKKIDKQTKPKEKPVQQPEKPEPLSDEKPFDFGGLPPRDLKKNLGCG